MLGDGLDIVLVRILYKNISLKLHLMYEDIQNTVQDENIISILKLVILSDNADHQTGDTPIVQRNGSFVGDG